MFATTYAWMAAGYLLGSIPFGLLLARAAGIDIRSVGSGNIGATNVLRTGNRGLAAATLVLDAGKGALAVWLALRFGGTADATLPMLAGLAAFLGHLFPVWLGFRGGKGVATLLGVTLAMDWRLGLAALLVWLAVALATRYSSLGGMAAALVGPGYVTYRVVADPAWFQLVPHAISTYLVPLWLMAALLFWKHRENITRLRAGTESRIGSKG